jgi:hypothetical protein
MTSSTEHLMTHGRELLRLLLQDHLDLRALREQHAVGQGRAAPVTDAGGLQHRKVEHGHVRHLATVFGTVRLDPLRLAGRGRPQPVSGRRGLEPDHRHSHTLTKRAAIEAARGSFQAAQEAITRQCGKVAGKRQVEQLTVAAASDIDAFYANRAPLPATDDTLLCLSIDGKGVVMRPEALRQATRKAAAAKPTSIYHTRLPQRGEAGPQADGDPGHRLRRRPRAPPAPRRHHPRHQHPRHRGWPRPPTPPRRPGRDRQVADRLDRHHQRPGDRVSV